MPRKTRGVCSIQGCGEEHKAKGFCVKHYSRKRSSPDRTEDEWGEWRGLSLIDRIAYRIRLEPDTGCWIWEGPGGQAVLSEGSHKKGTIKHVFGRRVFFEYFKEPLPEGFDVIQVCKDPLCLNPRHLEAVVSMSTDENAMTVSALKTREWRARNPIRAKNLSLEQAARGRIRLREWLDGKKSGPCSDCGGRFPPECMDFDHVRGKKVLCINIAKGGSASREALEEEIKKCDLVCANCHRTRTRRAIQSRGKDAVFEYRCDNCGNLFEHRQGYTSTKLTKCPGCEAQGLVRLPLTPLTSGGFDADV